MTYTLMPITRERANPKTNFYRLKIEWERDTITSSFVIQAAMHPAYQQIIGMGEAAIPLILDEIQTKPSHWFWALGAITGENPVPPQDRGKLQKMAEAWINWGRKNGYIK